MVTTGDPPWLQKPPRRRHHIPVLGPKGVLVPQRAKGHRGLGPGISMGFWWDFNGILMGDEWILIVLLWWNVMDVYLIKMDYFHGILWYNQGYRDLSCQQTWFCGKSPSRGGFNMRTSWFCSKPAILPSGSTSHWVNRQDRGPMTCMTLELLADIANIYIYNFIWQI
jgi:hypothetical protein